MTAANVIEKSVESPGFQRSRPSRASGLSSDLSSDRIVRYGRSVDGHLVEIHPEIGEAADTEELIERNPAAGAALPRRNRPEMRPLTPDETRRLLTAARGHPLEELFTLAVTTGMRQGELLGLRWRDIDWANSRLAVRHTLVGLHGRWWLGEPKTAKSERSVELTDPTLDVLRAHRDRQARALESAGRRLTGDDLIFADATGEPLWGRHVTTLSFKALLRRAGLPDIRFDDLRHTFATLQLTAGTNPKIVSEVLGHKDIAITLDR